MIFYNRELSWLQFNNRVLQQAQLESVPPAAKLRFLAIYANNQDEFFRVRIPKVEAEQGHVQEGVKGRSQEVVKGRVQSALLHEIMVQIRVGEEQFSSVLCDVLAELKSAGISFVSHKDFSYEDIDFCRNIIDEKFVNHLVFNELGGHNKVTNLSDGALYALVCRGENCEGSSKENSEENYTFFELPTTQNKGRFVELPPQNGVRRFAPIEEILRAFLPEILGLNEEEKADIHLFKILRNSEVDLCNDYENSMELRVKRGVEWRKNGEVILLVCDEKMGDEALKKLREKVALASQNMVLKVGFVGCSEFGSLPNLGAKLEGENGVGMRHPAVEKWGSVSNAVKRENVLLAYPYHTFDHILELLTEAAKDERVHTIKITLYRTAKHSKIVDALCQAAENGKRVTVHIELQARFDELQNIETKRILELAGVRVLTGQAGVKVHAKVILIEGENGVVLHVGTGNFNEQTAVVYSDFALLTADTELASDAAQLFDYLEDGEYKQSYPKCQQLVVAPHALRTKIAEHITQLTLLARNGEQVKICGKFNSLTDHEMIKLFYDASSAGVQINLVIRGACSLIPGIVGLSERIKVRSLVWKYLEHARMISFSTPSQSTVYLLSADLMTRNLDRRVEVAIPVSDEEIKETLHNYFELQFSENHDNIFNYFKGKNDE